MKQNPKYSSLLSILVVPVLLAGAGCNKNNNATEETGSTPPVVQPTNGSATNVDNTAVNQRDRSTNSLTPGDQGNTDADRAITQKIRQDVVSSTNNYSVVAQNIKIITVNGKVTLRGPVNTDAEKTGIANIAQSVAGPGNVDDQLEVKANQ